MDQLMEKSGYAAGQNWMTREYPGDGHTERAWGRRVHVPLEFLLGDVSAGTRGPGVATARR
jgi:hypothetical protein